jgi:hypothetical protein
VHPGGAEIRAAAGWDVPRVAVWLGTWPEGVYMMQWPTFAIEHECWCLSPTSHHPPHKHLSYPANDQQFTRCAVVNSFIQSQQL